MIKTHKTKTKHKTLYETFLFNGIALCNVNASLWAICIRNNWLTFAAYYAETY